MSRLQRTAAPSQKLRNSYLASLPEAQEWFVEERVQLGETWEVPDTGYAVFHQDTLVEFHFAEDKDVLSRWNQLRQLRPFETVLCKSFDHVLLGLTKTLGLDVSEVAYLFRKRNQVSVSVPEGFQLTRAAAQDVDAAWDHCADFFTSHEEVEQLQQTNALWIARCGSEFVGCGVSFELPGPFNAVDVGMVVREYRRNQGFGAALVSALSDIIEREGCVPICGCAKANFASKAALERAGFVPQHRLLRITFPD